MVFPAENDTLASGKLKSPLCYFLLQSSACFFRDDKTKIVSVMMPYTISVYQKTDGKVYIGAMNAGLMGRMFGGVVAEVMGKVVSQQQKRFIGFVNQ